MRRFLTVLAFVSPAIAGNEADAPGWKNIFSLLPPGSELQGVMLPRYDENHRLTGVLKSRSIALVDAARIAGKNVTIELFNPDQSQRGRIDLTGRTLYQDVSTQSTPSTGRFTTREPVEIRSERLAASGSGLYYFSDLGRGFLLGPVTTIIKAPPGKP